MIGKNQLQLGAEQLMSGMSSSPYATDGALGTESYGINPFVVPGAIYSLASPSNISTNIVDNIIATCAGFASTDTNTRYLLGNAANFYSYSGVSITKQVTGSASYSEGKSDLVPFNGNFYATTSSGYLVQWNGSTSLNEAYKALNDSSAPHPLLNYLNNLFIGDGNILRNLNTSGTLSSTSGPLVLPPDEIIFALGIDPGTGQILISTQKSYDISNTLTASKFIYLYDGVSAEYTRKIPVDDLVTAFINFQGQVICGIGQNIGVWSGTGITYLRLLKNVTLSQNSLPWKHHFAVFNRLLHVIDGPVILTYGPVVSGKMGFFYTAYEQTNNPPSYNLTCIFPSGNSGGAGSRLGIAYSNGASTYYVYTFDYGSTSQGQGNLYFNNIYFPRPVEINRVRIITTGITTNGGVGGFTFNDQDNNSPTVQNFVVPSNGAPVSGSPQYLFDFDNFNYKLAAIQPRLSFSGQGFGVIRFIIYYTVIE